MIRITIDGVSGPLAGQLMADPAHGVSTITRRPDGYQITGEYETAADAARLILAVDDAHRGGAWPTRKRALSFLRWIAPGRPACAGEQDGTVPPPPRRPESRLVDRQTRKPLRIEDTQPIVLGRHATDQPTSQLSRGFVPGFPDRAAYYPVVRP